MNRLARAALTLSIISVITMMIFFISIPAGAVAIILALLSRTDKLRGRARVAVLFATVGILASAGITTYSVVVTVEQYGGVEGFLDAYEDYANSLGYDLSLDDGDTSDESL